MSNATMPLLTIAIPTFDRNHLLRRHVAELLPQLSDETRLVILDNASPQPVEATLRDLLAQFGDKEVRVVRHRVNIGSSANVMRCLELCETPWIWVLGDDDRPLPTAVATALGAIKCHESHVFLSFNGMYRAVDREVPTNGLVDFINGIPNFANMTLMSDNLMQVAKMDGHLRMGYFYGYSLYPILACLLETLRADGGRCAFIPEQLIEWGPSADWSRILAGKGFGLILDIPMPTQQRRKMARSLNGVVGRYSTFAIHLLNQIGASMDAATARFLFSQAWHRLYKFQPSPMKWIHRSAGYGLLRFPRFGRAAYLRYRRWRQYSNELPPLDDMARS